MVLKRLFSVALLAAGMTFALPAHANIDLVKKGKNTESANMRRNFGKGNKYQGSREASRLQKPDEVEKGKHQFGPSKKFGSDAEESTAKNGCDGGIKGPGATASAKFGTQSKDEAAHSKLRGVPGAKFGCDVGVEATLVGVKADCQKQLAGDENLGLDAQAGGEATLGGGASCSCQGLTYAECEAFVGVKASADGTIGGQLCGLRLGVGLEGGVGAGAGAKISGGHSKRGWGFSIGAYLGVGGELGVSIDPDLSKLMDSKSRAEVLACLKQKALAGLGWLGNLLDKAVPPATNGGDAFMMP